MDTEIFVLRISYESNIYIYLYISAAAEIHFPISYGWLLQMGDRLNKSK